MMSFLIPVILIQICVRVKMYNDVHAAKLKKETRREGESLGLRLIIPERVQRFFQSKQ